MERKENPDYAPAFKDSDKKQLLKQGFVVYPIGEESIRSIRATCKQFFGSWDAELYPEFEMESATKTEAAINTNELFLPNSNWKTLEKQKALMDAYSQDLVVNQGLEVKAVIGKAPDYIELIFKHLKKNGQKLNDISFDGRYQRTLSRLAENRYVHLVDSQSDALLGYDWDVSYSHKDVFVAPLILPKATG